MCLPVQIFNNWVDEGDSAAAWDCNKQRARSVSKNSNTWYPKFFFVGPDTLINVSHFWKVSS